MVCGKWGTHSRKMHMETGKGRVGVVIMGLHDFQLSWQKGIYCGFAIWFGLSNFYQTEPNYLFFIKNHIFIFLIVYLGVCVKNN